MTKVASVRFKFAGKNYFFDPDGIELKCGDKVVVETARGVELATVRGCIMDVSDDEIVHPLKKVSRKATEHDIEKNESNLAKKDKSMSQCQEAIDKHKLDMKLIDLEFTLDNKKVIFYFTSEGRVDFRELVKDLATTFKRRIELRQVGVRDEAKILNGIGSCGKELCCSSWLPDFEPVSIKMAKTQNLILNPTKISGCCGRLMCCLKYENDNYREMKKGMPTPGDRVETQDGIAKVMDVNILIDRIKVRHIVEERTDESPEKLSTEVQIYEKKDIKKIKQKKPRKKVKESLPEELKGLVKE